MRIKATSFKNTTKSHLINRLDAITSHRVKWQVDYDKNIQELLLLLGNCLSVYKDIKKGTVEEVAFINDMKMELRSRGLTIQDNINVMTLIVRYVFEIHCQQVFTWARVLKVAVIEKIEPENFIQWVNDNGGIDKLAKGKGATKETKKKRLALDKAINDVEAWLEQQLNNPIGVAMPQEFHHGVDTGTYTLLIGFAMNDGSTKILSNVPDCSEGMIKTAKKKLAEFFLENEEQIKVAQLVAKHDKAMNDAIYSDSDSDSDSDSEQEPEYGKFEFYEIA